MYILFWTFLLNLQTFIAVINRNFRSIAAHSTRNYLYKYHIILRLILLSRNITWNIMWRSKVGPSKLSLRDPISGGQNYFSFFTRSLPWDSKYLAWKLEVKFVFISTLLHIHFRGMSTVTGYKTLRNTYSTSRKFNFVKHNPRLLVKYSSELKRKFHATEDVNAIAYLSFRYKARDITVS
jgi:hypothetical protein